MSVLEVFRTRDSPYEVLTRCAEPPLTGKESFNYETNREEIMSLVIAS